MLKIYVPEREFYNEEKNEFVTVKGTNLQLEHSLLSISKWESKWHKPFMTKDQKTIEEIISYIECMTLNSTYDPNVFKAITNKNLKDVQDYISDPMTATTFSNTHNKPSREIITSELIYYWMIALNIPFECQKWHINRLLTLIRVCNIKSQPAKKINKRELMNRNRALNAARRKALNTTG